MGIKEAIELVKGDEASTQDTQRVMAIAAALGIRTDTKELDPLVAILAVLDAHAGLLRDAPANIQKEVKACAETAALEAQGQVSVALAALLRDSSATLAQSVKEVARKEASSKKIESYLFYSVILTLFTSLVLTVGFMGGEDAESLRTGGNWYFPAWTDAGHGFIPLLFGAIFKAPAGVVFPIVFGLLFLMYSVEQFNEDKLWERKHGYSFWLLLALSLLFWIFSIYLVW
jgi:hypothetical protein